MCVIAAAAVASFALDAGGKVLQAQAQNKASAQNEASARASEAQGFNALSLRTTQQKESAIGDDQAADKKTALDISQTNLAAAENGVNGNSVNALTNELKFQQGAYHDSVSENLANQIAQTQAEKAGIVARTQSKINAVPKASPFATLMGVAGAAVNLGMRVGAHSPPGGLGDNPTVLPTLAALPRIGVTPGNG